MKESIIGCKCYSRIADLFSALEQFVSHAKTDWGARSGITKGLVISPIRSLLRGDADPQAYGVGAASWHFID
jgi:hypothetical protein